MNDPALDTETVSPQAPPSEPPVASEALIGGLRQYLPADAVLYEPEDLLPYECDGLTAYRRRPMIVCLPDTVDQVRAVVRFCHEQRIPVVARGAGTGLSGGALPHAEGVLLSLAKFTRILEIDNENNIARVEPGVRNLAISEAVSELGLFYAPDPSSQIACSIGGNVAENSGGVHCLKYGLTVHNVQGLKIVTMDGELIELGGRTFDTPGYDLLALMHGSEGLLGIIVEVTVTLRPQPEAVSLLLAAYEDISGAATAVSKIIGAGIIPAGLEMMDRLAIQAAEDYARVGYPRDAGSILLCELDGSAEDVEATAAIVQEVMEATGAVSIDSAADPAMRQRMWAGRKAAFPAVGRIAPDYYCMDGTIPRHRLPEVLQRIAEWSAEYGLDVANVFHAGDGNLHPLILYDANVPGELQKVEEFGGRILELCIEVGGSITGEHGVGVEKLNQMCVQFGAKELEQFHNLKDAFDPRGLLNPGKAVPTLHRCAEFGAMHVHNGRLPHPELERF